MTTNEDGSVTFTISKVEWEKYIEWEKSLPKLESGHFGAAGGGTKFEFIPTGLGIIVCASRDDNSEHKINLTDFDHW